METSADGQQSRRLSRLAPLALAAFVLLLRGPFLNHAIQGDDLYYVAGAEHAQIDPLHPNHFRFVFLGQETDMRGHSHPPGNAWILALLLRLFGDIRHVPFHASYIVFSLIAAWSVWSLARRYTPYPFWAALLFCTTPAFVINGTSLESDLPFLAFWLAAIVLFPSGWSAAPLMLAALTAYQAVFLTPILALYAWLFERHNKRAWVLTLLPPLTIAALQIFERATRGAVPAAVLSAYFQEYGFQALQQKGKNALALLVHSLWIVFPLLLPAAVMAAWRRRDRETAFLLGWIGIFFAGALIVFFAGSARYLLPMAAPVAILASRLPRKWLAPAFLLQLGLVFALALVNARHWQAYRLFAEELRPQTTGKRIWINGDWGLRYYLESDGALPLQAGQPVRPGEVVVTSELAYPVKFSTGGGALAPITQREIRPILPFRLIGLHTRSCYSSVIGGYLPFEISRDPIDRVRAELVLERKPTAEYLTMNAPEAENQIVSGIYELEGNAWRWMAKEAVVLLKPPQQPKNVQAVFTIPPAAPARTIRILLNGEVIAEQTFTSPGAYTLAGRGEAVPNQATITLLVDKTFRVPGDHRELGIIVSALGFK